VTGEAADPIALIQQELFRLRARPADVGPLDGITVGDRGHGNAVLQSTARGRRLDWFGSTEEILTRLRGLPDDAGPEVIRSEFASGT
jgi:hypothetical protein